MNQSRIGLNDSLEQVIIKMSNGNPGAIQTCIQLVKDNPVEGMICMLMLDELNLYESHLYMLWNDCCNRKIEKVKKILDYYRMGKIKKEEFEDRVKNVGYGKSFDDLLVD